MSFVIDKDQYIAISTTQVDVVADSNKVSSKIWFTTPALDQHLIDKTIQIQLQTTSHDQGWVSSSDVGSWSWFDIVVLDSPSASEPKVKDGLALVWFSHDNVLSQKQPTKRMGQKFTSNDIFSSLEIGNALAVRVCSQFPGWENYAIEGQLILQTSEKGRHEQPLQDEARTEYLGIVTQQISHLGATFDTYLNAATPGDAPPAYSLVREMMPTGPLRADQSSRADETPLRLMSLDGGGVRGISSLYILQAIMLRLTNDPDVKPCGYFDMIAGTSTGGLIAIMLGRLQMSIPECIKSYTSLASQIFSESMFKKMVNFSTTGAYYTQYNFEKELKSLIKQRTGSEDAPMLDPKIGNGCKVFVVSGQSQDLNHTSAEQFRTYPTSFPDKFSGCAIWEAARATSAAPTYLPCITINGTDFVDGGMRFNNPSILLMGEVNAVFGIARRIGCLVSIGTGMQPKTAIAKQATNTLEVANYLKSVASAAISIATDCETTHHLMEGLFTGKDGVYWRFNAGVKAGDDWAPMIALDDYEGMPKLVALTKTYLVGETKEIELCASRLNPAK